MLSCFRICIWWYRTAICLDFFFATLALLLFISSGVVGMWYISIYASIWRSHTTTCAVLLAAIYSAANVLVTMVWFSWMLTRWGSCRGIAPSLSLNFVCLRRMRSWNLTARWDARSWVCTGVHTRLWRTGTYRFVWGLASGALSARSYVVLFALWCLRYLNVYNLPNI